MRIIQSLEQRIAELATPTRKRVYSKTIIGISAAVYFADLALGRGNIDYFNHAFGQDFLGFYSAAKLFLDGRVDQIYNLRFLAGIQREIAPGLIGNTPYMNPPYALVFFAPFALMPYKLAWLAWLATQCASFVAGIVILSRALQADVPSPHVEKPRWLYLAAFPPVIMWLTYGQACGLYLLIISASIALAVRGREFPAGLALGMLALKPQLAIGVAVPFMLKLRWRSLAGGALAVGAWCAVGFWMFPGEMMKYPGAVSRFYTVFNSTEYGFPRWGEVTLSSFSASLLSIFPSRMVLVFQIISYIFGLLLIAKLWRRQKWLPASEGWRLSLATTILISIVFNAHLFQYDLVILILSFMLIDGTKISDSVMAKGWIPLVYILSLVSFQVSNFQTIFSKKLLGAELHVPLIVIGLLVLIFRLFQLADNSNNDSERMRLEASKSRPT